MRSLHRLLLSFIILILGPATVFASDFEGVISSELQLRGNAIQSKVFIKGKKIRFETDKGTNSIPVVLLIDISTQTLFELFPAQKTATGPFSPDLDSVATGRKKKEPPWVKTGRTETIAGYPAERYTRTYADGRIYEFWSTTKIKMSRDVALGMIPFVGQFARDDMYSREDPGAIELRKVLRLADGSVSFQKEVTKVEQISLSGDLFVVPAGYQRIDASKSKEEQKKGTGNFSR